MTVSFRKILMLLIIFLTTSSCASVKVNENDLSLRTETESIIQSLSPKFENETERLIVYRQVYGFFSCVKQIEGAEKWQAFTLDFRKTGSITQSFLNVFDKSFYELAGEVNYRLEKDMPAAPHARMVSKTIEDFEVYYIEGTKADSDLPLIEYLLKLYYRGIKDYFFISDKIKEDYARNISNLEGQKVKIYLLTDGDTIGKFFRGVQGAAATQVGYGMNASKQYVLTAAMLYKYHELFTAYTITHEMSHLIYAGCYIDPESTKPMTLEEIRPRMKELMDTFKPLTDPGPLKEGLAEYTASKFNLLGKYKLIDNTDQQLHYYFLKKNRTYNLKTLADKIYSGDDRFLSYETAHSLFQYIVNQYGKEKAFELTLTEEKDNDYQRILGIGLDDLNRKWNEYIRSL